MKAKQYGFRPALAMRYAKSRTGYGSKKGESMYDIVCTALEMDGLKRPESTPVKSWVIQNAHYIYENLGLIVKKKKKYKPFPCKVIKFDVDPTSKAFLETFAWRKVRMQALKKYGARCMCCGATPANGAVMNVDHIKPRKLFPELSLDVDNLQILCEPCNHGKGNWDQTDWRK